MPPTVEPRKPIPQTLVCDCGKPSVTGICATCRGHQAPPAEDQALVQEAVQAVVEDLSWL